MWVLLLCALVFLATCLAAEEEPYVIIYNEMEFHGEVTVAYEAAMNSAGIKYFTSDRRYDPGAVAFDKLHLDGSANYISHEDLIASLPEKKHLIKGIVTVTPQYELVPNEHALYSNLTCKKVLTVHIPHLYNANQMKNTFSHADYALFLSEAVMHKWAHRVDRFHPQLRSFPLMPLFDVSTPLRNSKFLMPSDNEAFKRFSKEKYVIVAGMISDFKRDYPKLLMCIEKPGFFTNIKLKFAGWINREKISATLGEKFEKYLETGPPEQLILETGEEDRAYPKFYASIQASRGMLLAHHHIHGDIPRHQYYEDQSSGNIGTALSNGVPLIGDMRLKDYYKELKGALLVYKDPRTLVMTFPQKAMDFELKQVPKLTNGKDDLVAVLQGYEFPNLHVLVTWLGYLSEEEVTSIRRIVIDVRDRIIYHNGQMLKSLFFPEEE